MNSESGTDLLHSPFAIRYSPFTIPPPAGIVASGLISALATVLASACGGCQSPPAAVEMWIVERRPTFIGSTTDPAEPLGAEASPRRVKLAGAINETLSFHFAVRPGEARIKHPGFRITPLTSVDALIDPSVVRVFRMRRVSAGSFPGWHIRSILPHKRDLQPLDVLVPVRAPRGGLPATLVPGETYYFWVDIAIPGGTFEGTYTAEIELTSAGATVGAVSVHLTVWPIVLPDEAGIPVIAEVDHLKLAAHHPPKEDHGRMPALGPDAPPSPPLSKGGMGGSAALRTTLQMLQSHRVTPVLHKLVPVVKVDAHGEVAIDWGPYDAVAEPCLSGRMFVNRLPLRLWPMPFHAVFSSLWGGHTVSSPGYAGLPRRYLARCTDHFEQKGWLDRSYAMLPHALAIGTDAPVPSSLVRGSLVRDWNLAPTSGVVEATRDFAAVARGVDGRIALASRLWPQDMAPYGWIDYPFTAGARLESRTSDPRASDSRTSDVDIWLPPAQFYDVQAMADERAAGRRTWLAVDRPPYSGSIAIYAPAAHVRVLTWQAVQLGAEALYLGCINGWPDTADHPTPEECVRADPNVLLYPGAPFGLDEPVASVRLKHLRRSLQDAAYRALLNKHGLEHVTATVARSLAPYAGSEAYRTHFADGRPIGWVDDPALFDLARDIMAERLISASQRDRAGRPAETFARNAAWRRFMLATRKLHIQVDGTRVRLSGARTTWEADVECALTIVNRTRLPVAGTVRFLALPQGWTAGVNGRPVTAIPPNSSRLVTLTAQATELPAGPAGFLVLPIEFATEDGAVHRCEARASFATAVPFDRLIRIDGDLSDWPPGAVNVASDFCLIAGGPADSSNGDGWPTFSKVGSRFGTTNRAPTPKDVGHPHPARPYHATTGFIMRHSEYLYMAINCEFDGQTAGPTSRRNSVDYDDLIPVGDELVEVLIDPFNTGTRSPADLHHIAVKPSGTYLTEKGIRLHPPCGPVEPWLADIDVATGVFPDRWTVELRIPLASFEDAAAEHTVWGFNITRYDASRQEFSTWSGASGNAYDPMSLGNLYLP